MGSRGVEVGGFAVQTPAGRAINSSVGEVISLHPRDREGAGGHVRGGLVSGVVHMLGTTPVYEFALKALYTTTQPFCLLPGLTAETFCFSAPT